jgi:sRNA-binding regulator protein Hfq
MADYIAEALRASQAEQTTVVVLVHGQRLTGVVVRYDVENVELRHDKGRTMIRREYIDAVTVE